MTQSKAMDAPSLEGHGEQEAPKSSMHGEEMVLTFLFGILLAGVIGILWLDFRTLTGADASLPFLQRPEVAAPIRPARDNDQVRRYSPQTRVDFGPGGKVQLPGLPGQANQLLSGSMTFHEAEDGIITAVGLIEPGTAIHFEKFIAEQKEKGAVNTLYLHSPGGSVRDAIEMAHFIRDQGLTTVVTKHGYCASSCPLVFSGGERRLITKPAALGVHQIFTSKSATGTLQQGLADAQAISAEAQGLLVQMGVDARAWIKAMATPKDKLYLFTEKEIEDYKWRTQ